MRKLSGIILTMALTAFFAVQVMAQTATPAATDDKPVKQTATTAQTCGKFVDNNNDGVCDNRGTQCKQGKGTGFTDANGDGICDHRGDGNCCKGNPDCCKGQKSGCGKGYGPKHRQGCGGPCGARTVPDKK